MSFAAASEQKSAQMLESAIIADEVVRALQSIPDLMALMDSDPSRIVAFHFLYGQDYDLKTFLYQMVAPSIAVVSEGGPFGGNFDGSTVWKYRIAIYFRASNVAGQIDAASYEHLWVLAMNSPIYGGAQNIRYTRLNIKNSLQEDCLDIADLPTAPVLMRDEDGMDLLCGHIVFPELGDN